jgi:hypothetical protein
VFAKVLAKAPADRFETCQDFADALRESLGVQPYLNYGVAPSQRHGSDVTPADPVTRDADDMFVADEVAGTQADSAAADSAAADSAAAHSAAANTAAADAAVAGDTLAESTVAEAALAESADRAITERTVAGGPVPDGAAVATMKRPVRIALPARDAAGGAGRAEPTTAAGSPPDNQMPASTGGPPATGGTRRRVAVAAAVVAVAAAVIGVVLAIGGKPAAPAKPATASYTFPAHSYHSGLRIEQTWKLSGHDGSIFTALITASSSTGKAITASYVGLIPTEITPNLSAVTFNYPVPASTQNANHLVIWHLMVPAHGSVRLGYHVSVAADGATRSRLMNCVRAYNNLARQLAQRQSNVVIKSLTIKPRRIQIAIGQKVRLTLSGILADGKGATAADLSMAIWKSANSAVATVSSAGLITGNGQGTTRITVQIGKASASTVVVVSVYSRPGSGSSYYSPPPTSHPAPSPTPTGTTTLTPSPLAVPPGSGQSAEAGIEAGGMSLEALLHLR